MENENNTSTDTVSQAENAEQSATLTQADVDKIVTNRLSRQKSQLEKQYQESLSSAVDSFLGEHGLDRDSLQTLVQAPKKEVSELEKLKLELTKSSKELERLRESEGKYKLQFEQKLIKDGIISTALKDGKSTQQQADVIYNLLKDKIAMDGDQLFIKTGDGGISERSLEEEIETIRSENEFLAAPTMSRKKPSELPSEVDAKTAKDSAMEGLRQALLKRYS